MRKFITLFLVIAAIAPLGASNVITYKASSKLPQTTESYSSGIHIYSFNASIISHEFADGIGTITFSGEVTSIGESAFNGCSSLYSITIPTSVTSIGDEAFFNCTGLTTITIPNSVTSIGEDAFFMVTNVVYSGTATGSPWSAKCVNGYVDGYYVYSNATKTILCGCSSAATGSITIPNGVTQVGYLAFRACSDLTSITIPNSVTSIGGSAFWCCRGLISVTIGRGVTYIGGNAFNGCDSLKKCNYTGTIADWCKIQFGRADSNPMYYSRNFYINDVEVKDLIIPNTIDTIKRYAFFGCSSLISVTIPNNMTIIGDYAFHYCDSLRSIIIPDKVTYIGDAVFKGCINLSSVTIGKSVKSIGYDAFNACIRLTKTNFTGTIADWCSIEFSGGISDNSNFANPIYYSRNFYINDVEVKNLVIPYGVTSLKDQVFWNCESLTSVTIPNSVKSIGHNAFNGCTNLTSVTIPNSVTKIGFKSFMGCTSLTSITIPDTVTSIGKDAFRFVNNIVYNGTATGSPWGAKCLNGYVDGYLVYSDSSKTTLCGCSRDATGSITIPNSVTTIKDSALYNCNGVTNVTVPISVTNIGKNAFYNVLNIGYEGGATGSPWGAKYMNGYVEDYLVYNDATKTKLCYCSTVATDTIIIPNSVTDIGNWAFYNCKYLKSVIIPEGINSIGVRVFSQCIGITSITLPNSVTSIGDYAFSDSYGLLSITIPNGVTSIGSRAFDGCSGLTSISCYAVKPPTCALESWDEVDKSIPLYVPAKSINAYITAKGWKEFTNIRSFVRGQCGDDLLWRYDRNSLIISGEGEMYDYSIDSVPWFGYRDSISTIIMCNGVTSIGNYAFYGCANKNFKKIDLPNSMTSIGQSAFANCTYLKNFTMGTDVEEIKAKAFDNDQKLLYVTCYTLEPPTLATDAFANWDAYLSVPCEAVDDYKVSPGWKLFTKENIRCIGAEPATTESVIVTHDDHSVTITWPTTDGADSYTIVINKGGVPFCILTFNAQGQLTNISFAPGRGMNNAVEAATAVAGGYRFTITSLDPGTQYDYEVDTQDAAGISIANYTGEFTTTGGSATSFDQLPDSPVNRFTKILKDGQLLILRDGKTYNAQGTEVR